MTDFTLQHSLGAIFEFLGRGFLPDECSGKKKGTWDKGMWASDRVRIWRRLERPIKVEPTLAAGKRPVAIPAQNFQTGSLISRTAHDAGGARIIRNSALTRLDSCDVIGVIHCHAQARIRYLPARFSDRMSQLIQHTATPIL